MSRLFIVLLMVLLQACTTTKITRAPVSDVTLIEPIPSQGVHIMRRGETLYSTAWRYGLDYRYLARRNHLHYPYHVHQGQTIYLKEFPPMQQHLAMKSHATIQSIHLKARLPSHHEPSPSHVMTMVIPLSPNIIWHWPAKGPVQASFSNLNKGINIAGRYGEPVYATAAGRVVYCGDGLRGYGNLIIIKHNTRYLSAYAFNSRISIKEGQLIKSGQKIAEMGYNAQHKPMLHFEIRQDGNPVNPLVYLRG